MANVNGKKPTLCVVGTVQSGCEILQKMLAQNSDEYYSTTSNLVNQNPDNSSDTVYVFMYRHPFDIFSSLLETDFVAKCKAITDDDKNELPIYHLQSYYIKSIRPALRLWKELDKSKRIKILYEDFIRNPAMYLKKIYEHIGLTRNLNAVQLQDKVKVLAKNLGFSTSHIIDNHKTSIETMPIGWTEGNKSFENVEFDLEFVDLVKNVGYPLPKLVTRCALFPSQRYETKVIGGFFDQCIVLGKKLKLDDPLDIATLKEKCLQLSEHFIELRTFFKKEDSNRQFFAKNLADDFLIYEDFSNEDETVIQQKIAARKESIANSILLNCYNQSLFKLLLVKLQNNCYEILYFFHHMITDALGCRIFHKTLWQAYLEGRESNKKFSKMNFINFSETKLDAQNHHEFWSSIIKQRNPWSIDHLAQRDKRSFKSLEKFRMKVRYADKKLQFYPIIIALFKTIGKLSSENDPLIAIRFNRRNTSLNISLKDRLGWFAGDLPFRIDARQNSAEMITDCKKQFSQVEAIQFSYDFLFIDDKVPALCETSVIRLNYLPFKSNEKIGVTQFENTQSSGLVESETILPTHYLIDFWVYDHRTHCDVVVTYSNKLFNQSFIESLVSLWKTILLGQLLKSTDVPPL